LITERLRPTSVMLPIFMQTIRGKIMKNQYNSTRISTSRGTRRCLSKQSKAGANCKAAQQVPCRTK
jgi:hypothetical protein